MKNKKLLWLVTVLLALSMALAGCGGEKKEEPKKDAPKAAEKLKVAFVYIGPVGDAGWTYSHEQGRKYLMSKMPDVESVIVESVPEGADAERVITQLVEQGAKVVFATSFGYMDPTLNVAKKYPNVTFMHCSGFKTAPNMGTYFGRM